MAQGDDVILVDVLATDEDDFGLAARQRAKQRQRGVVAPQARQVEITGSRREDRREQHAAHRKNPVQHLRERLGREHAADDDADAEHDENVKPARHAHQRTRRSQRRGDRPDAEHAAEQVRRRHMQVAKQQAAGGRAGERRDETGDVASQAG